MASCLDHSRRQHSFISSGGTLVTMVATYLGDAENLLARQPGHEPFMLCDRHVRSAFEEAAPCIRKAILTPFFGGRVSRWGGRKLGPFAVSLSDYGTRWSVVKHPYQPVNGQLGAEVDRVEGHGVVPLVACLSSASHGTLYALSLRLLGLELQLDDLRQIQAFIDSRLARPSEGKPS